MGTNFYIREKKPTVRKTIHIGKRSAGWLFHWDSCDEGDWPRWCDSDRGDTDRFQSIPHSIHSVEDIRAYLRTGEWELVDEDGDTYDDWKAEIEGFCSWDGGKKAHDAAHPDSPTKWTEPNVPYGYRDSEGQVFDRGTGFI